MIVQPYSSLAVGVAFALAAVFLICRHWLLGRSGKYPSAPSGFLQVEWMRAMAFLFVGLHFVFVFFSGAPHTMPPQPAPMLQFVAFVVVMGEASLFINMLRQRLPRSQWDLSKCRMAQKGRNIVAR